MEQKKKKEMEITKEMERELSTNGDMPPKDVEVEDE